MGVQGDHPGYPGTAAGRQARQRVQAVRYVRCSPSKGLETGLEREEVLRICVVEAIPVYQGRIDKTLFAAHLDPLEQEESLNLH